MSTEGSSDAFQDVATRFSALWRALIHDGDALREPGETRLLIDRVRDALDRRQARLDGSNAAFVANSFLLEDLVHDGATQIHRIRHRDLQSLHALKTLHPDRADNAVACDLLLREARLTMMLRHRHILAAHVALRLPDGRPALVLEWVTGTLSNRLNAGPFSLRDVHETMAALFSGLEALHAAGLVHADISPDNLLFSGDRLAELKIADFGIALEKGQSHSDLDLATAGHTEFAAPEQSAGGILDNRSDLYACGRILQLLLERCADGGNAVDQLSALAQQLTRCDPAGRPESASAALELLKEVDIARP